MIGGVKYLALVAMNKERVIPLIHHDMDDSTDTHRVHLLPLLGVVVGLVGRENGVAPLNPVLLPKPCTGRSSQLILLDKRTRSN